MLTRLGEYYIYTFRVEIEYFKNSIESSRVASNLFCFFFSFFIYSFFVVQVPFVHFLCHLDYSCGIKRDMIIGLPL